ncbi:hypothetical protein [Streptomyces sp. ODS28]|uniref:Vgb family protein n=1 Tax=Streptomyces sp. ODS28 TaxID=3136688 RepID=UPI0031EDF9BB
MTFENIFDSGGGEADSAKDTAQSLHDSTPGAEEGTWDEENDTVSGSASGYVRDWESARDPWLLHQTPHGAFGVLGFLDPLFQRTSDVSSAQRQASEDPRTTSDMASSTKDKAFASVKAEIREEDMPGLGEEAQQRLRQAHDRAASANVLTALITADLGNAEGIALDTAHGKAYVASRSTHRLIGVDLASGATYTVRSDDLGEVCDVALDGGGLAYVTDFSGRRLLSVDLATGATRQVAGELRAYGVGLYGGTVYVTDWDHQKLIAVDPANGEQTPVAEDLGAGPSGVAMDGDGTAYVGHRDGTGPLWRIDLRQGAKTEVATVSRTSPRIALDGAGRAYVSDHLGDRLHEVHLADGAQRVAATGGGGVSFSPVGLALDRTGGWLYVATWEGQLWRISQRAVRGPGAVNVKT